MTKAPFKPRLDKLVFEVRYDFGYLYLDRCGQTIVDILKSSPDWLLDNSPKYTTIIDIGRNLTVQFANDKFIFTAESINRDNLDNFKGICQYVWKIIQSNLGLDTYIRVGCRIYYLLPTNSRDESEKRIRRSKINIILPKEITSNGYHSKVNQVLTILEKEATEYRVELRGITQITGRSPSYLDIQEPRLLSKNQRKAQIELEKARTHYSSLPMFAVQLDVDCIQFQPITIKPQAFITEQLSRVDNDFFPILEAL